MAAVNTYPAPSRGLTCRRCLPTHLGALSNPEQPRQAAARSRSALPASTPRAASLTELQGFAYKAKIAPCLLHQLTCPRLREQYPEQKNPTCRKTEPWPRWRDLGILQCPQPSAPAWRSWSLIPAALAPCSPDCPSCSVYHSGNLFFCL